MDEEETASQQGRWGNGDGEILVDLGKSSG